jgi:hypothetical protein
MPSLDLTAPPTPGDTVAIREREYLCVGVEPYTRRDGVASFVITWRGWCWKCGEVFAAQTGLRGNAPPESCKAHRGEASPAALMARRANMRKARETQRANAKANAKVKRAAKKAAKDAALDPATRAHRVAERERVAAWRKAKAYAKLFE